jgi:signal peptidase I
MISGGRVNLLGISAEIVTSGSMEPTINEGDIVVVQRDSTYSVGDIVTYEFSEDDHLVTHRLIGGSAAEGFTIKGDANESPDRHSVDQSQIIGKVIAIIPGSVALVPFFGKSIIPFAIALAIAVFACLYAFGTELLRDKPEDAATVPATSAPTGVQSKPA